MKYYFVITFLFVGLFLSQSISAAQVCKSASIVATTPDTQLTDNGDGTISDIKTGLMWMKCALGTSGDTCETGTADRMTWLAALQMTQILNDNTEGFAGYHDWRLPNIKELLSIVEKQCSDPAINLGRFPNTESSAYWSGTPAANPVTFPNDDTTWYVSFTNGFTAATYRNESGIHARLVRYDR